ncbi:CatB-related O-acetyltransferase [Flavobacterium sp. GSB-24]|uniref:CatB-related O-acetyltransferase n=1 Tax=Flavobacterium sp. GSB-24 TaxID=2994319 RepID=UPI0024938E5A|nr:CatB-related O-acetyltransferase [Flavobacterium sp. GSB-24]
MKSLLRKIYRTFIPAPKKKISGSATIDNCEINDFVKISQHSYFYNSSIQSYTYFAGFNSVMNASVGKFCSIGDFSIIGAGNHPVDFISTSPIFYSPHAQCGITFSDDTYFDEMKKTTIGNDVWIGAYSIVMSGVKIGDGAIIASGSFVNKDVEPYSIVGGTPAKLIRKRFDDVEINKLLKLKWWDKPEHWLRENFKLFHDKANLHQFF